ncbi:copine-8 [Nilaparvata lugens]|uniref:copine-8 n=1 Tax=Nilaparvata lugens TaxID=108931 RepID=UPI00193D8725|nr:copine-8 [Nilaparvata lugens]XP_039283441.1 copine-8 [Nilaparvata lugens]
MTSFTPGSAAQPTTEVELSLSCRSLQGKDVLSKSDPMCVTYIRPFGESRWVEYHRTEVISNSHDPDFAAKILLPYRFEEQQPLRFLFITAEELAALKDEVIFKFSGHKLDRKDFFGKSDPFLEIHKAMESGDYTLVLKTEVKKWTLNPAWLPITVPVRTLCNGDYERSLKFVCYDWNASGRHSLIGEFYTNLKTLSQGPVANNRYACIHPEKQVRKKGTYIHSGEIALDQFELRPVYSFLDYIKGGTQLHCSIAIDFTGSNGNPEDPNSLHFVSPGGLPPNCYEQAITAVGSIIQDYDSDKLFPVLGFGARLPPDGKVSHEFFVNMDPNSPYCNGVQGVLDAYRSCIRQVQLYGPTNFAPVINHVAKFAATYRDGSSYFILLILTDGVITDMPQTTQAIVNASVLPLSVIIVGVGNADFTAMETLDADTVALTAGGVRAARDIVQFVPFNKFISVGDPRTARLRLAREVLAEVPTQFVGYMKANSIVPKPPISNVTVLPPDPELLDIQP